MPIASSPISSPAMTPLNTSCDVIHVATTTIASAAFGAEEHGAGEVVTFGELVGRAAEAHLALLEQHRPAGDRERDVQRLLDQDDRHALRLAPLDDPEQLPH